MGRRGEGERTYLSELVVLFLETADRHFACRTIHTHTLAHAVGNGILNIARLPFSLNIKDAQCQ